MDREANFHTSKPNIYILQNAFYKRNSEHGGKQEMLTKVFPKSLCERSLQQEIQKCVSEWRR